MNDHPVHPQAERLNQHGESLFSEQCFQEAMKAFQKAHDMEPLWVLPLNNMGVLYWHMGMYQEALVAMEKAYRVDPYHHETVQNLIDMMIQLDHKDSAFLMGRTFLKKYPDDPVITSKVKEIRPDIRIVHHMARSGGTIISKCLGCMDKVVLLSEIHPMGMQWFDPMIQAQQWFGLFRQEEIQEINLIGLSFLEKILLIYEKVCGRSENLVIRDWSHLDFTAVPFVKTPTYQLSTALVLEERFRVVHVATVRHPIDQWLSLRTLSVMKDQITLEAFLQGYRKFAEAARKIGFIRYEDFIRDPIVTMQHLCQILKVPFSPDFIHKWHRYHNITGDTNNQRVSKKEIQAVPRRPMEKGLMKEFKKSKDYRISIELLGYDEPKLSDSGGKKFT